MKKLIVNLWPAEFSTHPAYWRAFGLGMVYCIFVIFQLYTFESFPGITLTFGIPGDMFTAFVVAILLPLVEIMALPFLISMRTGHRLRQISRKCVIAAPVLWLIIALWTNTQGMIGGEIGLFGATLPLENSHLIVIFFAILLWAAVLATRELPSRHKVN